VWNEHLVAAAAAARGGFASPLAPLPRDATDAGETAVALAVTLAATVLVVADRLPVLRNVEADMWGEVVRDVRAAGLAVFGRGASDAAVAAAEPQLKATTFFAATQLDAVVVLLETPGEEDGGAA